MKYIKPNSVQLYVSLFTVINQPFICQNGKLNGERIETPTMVGEQGHGLFRFSLSKSADTLTCIQGPGITCS